jgi:hypothetical protein
MRHTIEKSIGGQDVWRLDNLGFEASPGDFGVAPDFLCGRVARPWHCFS